MRRQNIFLAFRRCALVGIWGRLVQCTSNLGPVGMVQSRKTADKLRSFVSVGSFVIIRDHDWPRNSRPHYTPSMVCHCKVHVESNLFSVMTAVASYAEWEDHRSGGEIKDFSTIELDDARCVFIMLAFVRFTVPISIRI